VSAALPEPNLAFDLAGKKILIVDDSTANLELLHFSLTKKKFQVFTAATGQAGLQLIQQEDPDLVLLDIELPDLNGLELCKQVKADPKHALLPIIFISGLSDSQTLLRGFEVGASDYVVKPLKLAEVLARIRTNLKIVHLMELEKTYNKALQAANEEINKLLGVTTHDLRNPLVSIRGLAEFLADGSLGPITEEQKQIVGTIREAADTLLFLVENLLDYSSVESGTVRLDCQLIQLNDLLHKAVKLHSIGSAKKNIRLVLDDQGPAQPVYADANRMAQVIDNLITNAIKFSPFDTEVHIATQQDAQATTICVRDQGPGIPEGERDKLFKSFGKTSVQPTNHEKSTGLGLVICRKIIESHGGSIDVRNLPGRGAEFFFTLPQRAGPAHSGAKGPAV
jgi:signal transduction histidine kinase